MSRRIKCHLTDIDNYSLEFESLVDSDYSYPAKILYSMDTRFQRFMSQNKIIKDKEDVSNRLVNLSNLSDACLDQSFNVSFPPAFKLSKERLDDYAPNSYTQERELKRERPELEIGRAVLSMTIKWNP